MSIATVGESSRTNKSEIGEREFVKRPEDYES